MKIDDKRRFVIEVLEELSIKNEPVALEGIRMGTYHSAAIAEACQKKFFSINQHNEVVFTPIGVGNMLSKLCREGGVPLLRRYYNSTVAMKDKPAPLCSYRIGDEIR